MYKGIGEHGGAMGEETPSRGRIEILAAYQPDGLLDDPELSNLTQFAARLCDVPTALISLVGDEVQTFVARTGMEATQTPRSVSFCAHTMLRDQVMEVPDARVDERFADNALVTDAPFIRFYAGAPLISKEGVPLGALCVISPEPRQEGLTALQREGLSVLASAVMRQLNERRSLADAERALAESRGRFDALADAIPQMAWSTLPDGMTDYFNARWYEFTGAKEGDHFGAGWLDALHPDDREVANRVWMAAVDSAAPYEVEYRLKRYDGQYRWTLARGLPMKDASGKVVRWFGTNTDIHESKRLVETQQLLGRELNHRIKNIFSVIGGLVSFSSREHPELAPLADTIRSRIQALAKAHDYVRPDDWAGGGAPALTLRQLLGDLVEPYGDSTGSRLLIEGDDLSLSKESVTPIALLFHELATNAVKYGALSTEDGRVTVSVRREGEEILMDWTEQGGPIVDGPNSVSGFGSQLVDMSVRRQLGGRYERHWDERGLRVAIAVPAGRV